MLIYHRPYNIYLICMCLADGYEQATMQQLLQAQQREAEGGDCDENKFDFDLRGGRDCPPPAHTAVPPKLRPKDNCGPKERE